MEVFLAKHMCVDELKTHKDVQVHVVHICQEMAMVQNVQLGLSLNGWKTEMLMTNW